MARTRIDPWQADQPDLHWGSNAIVSVPSKKAPDCDFPRSGPKVLLPKSSSNYPYLPKHHLSSSSSLKVKPLSHISANKHDVPLSLRLSPQNPFFKHSKKKSRHIEFETAANKVLAAFNNSNSDSSFHKTSDFEYALKIKKRKRLGLPDGDKRKNMIPKVVLRDIGAIISRVCPKLSSTSPTGSKIGLEIPSLPRTPTLSPHSSVDRLLGTTKPSSIPVASTAEVHLESQEHLQDPTNTTSDDPCVVMLDKSSLLTNSPTKAASKLPSTLGHQRRNLSASTSEKSSTPISQKEISFAALASAAPSLFNSSNSIASSNWPSSCKSLPSYPIESVSSISSKSMVLSSTKSLSKSSECMVPGKRNVSITSPEKMGVNGAKLGEPRVTELNEVSLVETESSRHITSSGSLVFNPASSKTSQSSSRQPESFRLIKKGFLGFSQDDGKKLKVRFHVNTNILASSLDLLDLHKNAGMPSGSPSICSHCNIIFSSVKHCKYHQSIVSSDVASDPSRHNNIQEDGVWLCPWCPLMCTTIDILNKHKLQCREKGHCHQELKASSVRKSASSSSRRRSMPAAASNGILLYPNRYQVVHGKVIQL